MSPGDRAVAMANVVGWPDTPSIINRVITQDGKTLRYSDLTGREKRDYLFAEGIRPTAYDDGSLPDVVRGVFPFLGWAWRSFRYKRLPETLLRIGDEFEEPRAKLFHTYGTTAKICFTPEPRTPYSGIFSDVAYGLARFSYAGPVLGVGVVPGLALKFPVDGDNSSENLVVMRKLDRQQPPRRFLSKHSHNSVFQNAFTNILPLPRVTNVIMRVVNRRFETVVEKSRGLHQSPDNLARVHQDGQPVPGDEVNAPYRLIFVPTEQARRLSNPRIDFRLDLARNVGAGAVIYEVFGLSESEEEGLRSMGVTGLEEMARQAHRVGSVAVESEFVASSYGDFRLFFRHSDRWMTGNGAAASS